MVLYERALTVGAPKEAIPYATALALNAARFGAAASFDPASPIAELNLDGERIRNDISIARLVASSKGDADLIGAGWKEQATIDGLVTLAEGVVDGKITAEEALKTVSFGKGGTLYDGRITIADIALWSIVAKDEKLQKAYPALFAAILNDKRFEEAHAMVGQFATPKAGKPNANAANAAKKSKDEGKFVDLPGAEMGKVIVRFPPEASGYLHIGHAKAALLNQYYQQTFQGQLIMRFDDTNPAKENAHFEEVIKEDLAMLQIKPDRWTHSSDYFDMMLDMCERLIKEGKAFVDDTDKDTMRAEREERKDSKYRDTPPAANLALWEEMKAGTERGQQCCVRIKIDMKSNNGTMRDPTIYRCKPEEHVRTGMKYKVYPTYDFACPIVDSVEGVTHTLRTTEYHDRDDQYFFIADALGLRKPHIWEYARLNMTNTVMSKRKLTWFVEEGIVDGWDDPRFPTVRGVMRRGMTVEGLKQFIVAQGGSRSIVMMEWDKIWAFNKKVIDPVAPRYTALDTTSPLVPVLIAEMKKDESAKVNLHPKDAAIGEKTIHRGPKLLVEQIDAKEMKVGDVVTFVNWGNLKIAKVDTGADGVITAVHATLDLANQDFKKTLKVTWLGDVAAPSTIPVVAVTYDHIISKAVIGKDEDWKQFINRESIEYTKMIGEPAIAGLKKGDIIQIQRKGFFICDHPYAAKSEFTGAETPLLLIAIPDGSAQPTKAGAAKPAAAAAAAAAAPGGSDGGAAALYREIEAQGNTVRDVKAKDPKSAETKAAIDKLLALKKAYKEATGKDYKPGEAPAAAAAPAGNNAASLYAELESQGNLVRELKGKDAKSQATKDAIAKLLELKKNYKEKTGQEYKPGTPPAAPAAAAAAPAAAPAGNNAAALYAELEAQGNLVRELKSKDAKSAETKGAIEKLLALKKAYKEKTGQDYKPGAPPAAPAAAATPAAAPAGNNPALLYSELEAQGNLVRELKGKDAKSAETKGAIEKLLALKKAYKEKTGQDYKPGAPPAAAVASPGDDIAAQIVAQGDIVRAAKTKDAKSAETKGAIEKLLALKKAYKEATGKDYQPAPAAPAAAAAAPKKEEKKPQQPKAEKPKKEEKKKEEKKEDGGKKQTKLGMEMRKDDNYSEWYSQVITKAEMIEYYDVSGCYVLRPWAYGIWEKMGVKNCYFPMFVSQGALEREKDHIADFAPEVAWVTRAGNSEMAEPIAIRPTSETVMYPSYRKWVQSHRDLPLKLNQWCNVVRWEFKHPTPFLRTREFLWQEGHTAYANPEDAQREVFQILDLYAGIYEELLAVPVIKGRKSEKEKFAGGDFTTTVEAYVPVNGRGVQGATSHHLGQNFSKMFDINFEGDKGKKEFAYQNSWGLTTRTIGAMVMVHGDDAGLVLPPRVASIQVIALPVGITASTTDVDREKLVAATRAAVDTLLQKDVRAEADLRDNYSPGWKFNHWELKGVPIRMEIGPKDLAAGQATLVTRFDGSKQAVPLVDLATRVPVLLEEIHAKMFQRVLEQRNSHMKTVTDFGEFRKHLDEKCILLAPFCGRPDCEDAVKRDSQRDDLVDVAAGSALMGAKTLCIPIEQPSDPLGSKCIHPDCKEAPKAFALFGRIPSSRRVVGRSEMGATSGSLVWLLLLAALAAAPAAAIVNEMREVVKNSACMEQVVVDLPFAPSGWCIRLLNGTHQVGCGSSMNGNEGVIVVARTRDEIEGARDGWKERFPDYTGGFMLLMDELLLDGSTAPLLLSSSRVAGVLLMPSREGETIGRDTALSAEAACPNRHSSLYSDWRACGSKPASASNVKAQWNGRGAMMEQGMRFTDWPKPMIRVLNETVLATMIKCHDAYNVPGAKVDVEGRLCAVGTVKTFELAAGSSEQCMRRQKSSLLAELGMPPRALCDALQDMNVFGVYPPGVANKTGTGAYLAVVTRMDGVSVVPDSAPATYGTMTALVTALTAAKVIGDNLDTFEAAAKTSNRRLLFAFLHGESFDYVGSARWVHDMEAGVFPPRRKPADANEDVPEQITMGKIALAVELQQLDGGSSVLHAHVDGKNYDADEKGKGKIKKALEKMRSGMAGDRFELKEDRVNANGVLPPSSLHSILKKRRQTPAVLVTSFDEQYSNRRFHSSHDRVMGGKEEVDRVKKSMAAVARGVVALMADHVGIDEATQKKLKIDQDWLDMLSSCFIATTKVPDCAYLKALFPKTDKLFDRSTFISAESASTVRQVLLQLLVLATGEHSSTSNVRDRESCKHVNEKQALFAYLWQADPWSIPANTSYCYRTSVSLSDAKSIAFIPDDNGDMPIAGSNQSTWVESRMAINPTYSLFLVESRPADWTLLWAGLITVLLSILIVGRCDDSSFIVDEGERAAEEGEPL
uniref:Glutamyl-tRNA synthetase n=1 Tax=Pristionchus pacificus TaxID=54126 RepID=A0A2A6BUB6_PRIPA|eukprot:PDM69468.1 ears-1 [Pristionchus pacificus]